MSRIQLFSLLFDNGCSQSLSFFDRWPKERGLWERDFTCAESNRLIMCMQNATPKPIKCDTFQLNSSSVEYSTDAVEYTTEVRQLIKIP